MINYKNKLDDKQYLAVTSKIDGNKICIASAGTGKTYTLTHRIAYLIDNGINPDDILLLTFTNKAAEEMISRTNRLLKENNPDLQNIEINGGTFHHIAITLMYKYINLLEENMKGFSVINVDDCVDIITYLRDKFIEEYYKDKPAFISNAKKNTPKAKVIYSTISNAFNNNIELEDAFNGLNRITPEQVKICLGIAKKYNEYKQINKYYDFDDLLKLFAFLMKHPIISKKIKRDYPYVFVDEVQDINKIQYEIIKGLEGNIFLVGDAKQAIYGFRGSDSKYINQRNKYFNGYEEFYLTYNYRSSKKVIESANSFISYQRPEIAKHENLICTKEIEGSFAIKHVRNDNVLSNNLITDIKNIFIKDKDATIGILLRTNAQSRIVETALVQNNIPYNILCGLPFFSRQHVRDISAFIKLVANPLDIISYNRVAQLFPSIGVKSAEILFNIWESYKFDSELIKNNIDRLLGNKKYANSAKLLTNIYLEAKDLKDVKDILNIFCKNFYFDYLEKTFENSKERKEDIDGLLGVADENKTINKFLNFINLMEQNKLNEKESSNIFITTVHKSKGLEYDYVLIPYTNENVYPFVLAKRPKEFLEEENMFYVALTRAKIGLILYHVEEVLTYDGKKYVSESKYLKAFDKNTKNKNLENFGINLDFNFEF